MNILTKVDGYGPKRLEFGNPEDIKKAEEGIYCTCKHPKSQHPYFSCRASLDEVCNCHCGNQHQSEADCDCMGFKLKMDMVFHEETGTYKGY